MNNFNLKSIGNKGATRVTQRGCSLFAVLALAIAAFAISAAPASADTVTMGNVTKVSYDTAHVTGSISVSGFFSVYTFQYSTNGVDWTPGPSGFSGNGQFQPLSADITGLKGGTKYFVRLSAFNFSTTVYSPEPHPEFTTLFVDPPIISATDNASEVFSRSATATGKVQRPTNEDDAFDVSCRFEYVTDAQFKATGFQGAMVRPCAQNPIGKADAGVDKTVSAQLGCTNQAVEAPEGKCPLEPETTYHLRLAAENAAPGVVTKEAAATFTTTTAPTGKPTILTVDDASEVSYRTAKASATLERPAGADPALNVNCRFEYVTDRQFNETGFDGASRTPCATDPVTTSGPVSVTAQLKPNAGLTYHLRLFAQNANGTVTKDAPNTFDTVPITTLDPVPPAGVGYTTAQVSGTVVALPNLKTYWTIIYSPVGVNGDKENPRFWADTYQGGYYEPNEAGFHTFEREITGLKGGTHYGLAVISIGFDPVTNQYETDENGETRYTLSPLPNVTFDTDPVDPALVLSLDSASSVSYTTASVSGEVSRPANPHPAFDVQCRFQYVTDEQFDASGFEGASEAVCEPEGNATEDPIQTAGPSKVTANLTGLTHATEYHLRLRAANANPTPDSKENTFTTLTVSPPVVTLDPVTSIAANTAHFSGSVSANAPGPLDAPGEAAYETSWYIECVPVCPELARAGGVGVVKATDGTVPLSIDVTDLDANQPYEIKLVATNVGGTSVSERKFTTPLVKATVRSFEGASDGEGGYTLQGIVNPNNSFVTDCKFEWGPTAPDYAFSADCSPMPGGKAKPVTVEAHLAGLTPGAVYHALLVVTNGAGTSDGGDQEFIPVLFPREKCANETLRRENFSLGLPECRAYEQVSPQSKNSGEIYGAMGGITADGNAVLFASFTNFADAGNPNPVLEISQYTSRRTGSGWGVAPLNGPLRSYLAGPDGFSSLPQGPMAYSADLRSTIWAGQIKSDPAVVGQDLYIRHPDGTFTLLAKVPLGAEGWVAATRIAASDDFSHVAVDGVPSTFGGHLWGTGVYEFTPDLGPTQPRQVDVDNTGTPISTCSNVHSAGYQHTAMVRAISPDGRTVIFLTGGGCGGANPPFKGVFARVDATTTYDLTASKCTRTAGDPGGVCRTPELPFDDPRYLYTTPDGSRVFFSTKRQLLNSDTDETDDIYFCDLPTTPEAPLGKANPCPKLTQIRGTDSGTNVESVLKVSPDGSTVYFGSKSALAENEGTAERKAIAGDRNIYVWRQDKAHPLGQTSFIARLADNDIYYASEGEWQTTPDGRYLSFRTLSVMAPNDTDTAGDIYRYDAEANTMKRVSIGTTGSSGNADGFDAEFQYSQRALSNDGDVITFSTFEPLSPLDGNGNRDVYFWSHGRVFRASQGAKGADYSGVSASGADVFFTTREQLVPGDRDQGKDVYDARVEGGFPQIQPKTCSGEACLPPPADQPHAPDVPTTLPPADPGNVKPKTCPKGKVVRNGRCVKKQKKRQSKKSHRKHKRAGGHDRGSAK